MIITFNNTSIDAESLYYNPDSDSINIVIDTDDVNGISDIIMDSDAISEIHTETDTYKGYSEIKRFAVNYLITDDIFRCYISLESDESTHEKLLKRIKALEDAKENIVEDVQALQKVNLATLIKDGLISDDKAAILSPIEKPTAGQISLDDLKEGIGKV